MGSPYRQQPPKKISTGAIVGICLGVIAIGMLLLTPMYFAFRQGFRQAKSRLVARDMVELTAGMRAGDPRTFNSSYQPTTEGGRQFKVILAKQAQNYSDYLDETKEARTKHFLQPSLLSNDAGRADARRIHNEYRVAETKLRNENDEYFEKFAKICSDSGVISTDAMQQVRNDDRVLRQADDQTMTSIDNIINFVDQKKPTLDETTGWLLFQNTEDAKTYNDLVERQRRSNATFLTFKRRVMASRQNSIDRMLSQMQAGQ